MTTTSIALRATIYGALLIFGIFTVVQSAANPMGWIILVGAVLLFGLLAYRVVMDRARRQGPPAP